MSMDFFKSYLAKMLKQGTASASAADGSGRMLDPKEFEEHKAKTLKAFKAAFTVVEEAPAAEKLRRVENWPTVMVSGGAGLQYWESNGVAEWRVFYRECGECAKPIYGRWYNSVMELAKEATSGAPPECSTCKPLCPLRTGDAYCPQKRGKYGCQWWQTAERKCVVEMIGLK